MRSSITGFGWARPVPSLILAAVATYLVATAAAILHPDRGARATAVATVWVSAGVLIALCVDTEIHILWAIVGAVACTVAAALRD
jgi:hypothetical protein